jgi:hypothetical protein
MKLSQLTAKPQLVEFKIEDEDTIKKYGEAITFFSWDRQPMDIFMKLASATDGNAEGIISIVKDLILDEEGKPILGGTDNTMLPSDVLMKAIALVTQKLGG